MFVLDQLIWFQFANSDSLSVLNEKTCFNTDVFRYRIGPFEVESALIEHHAVAEAAVVSCPDPVRGEVS